MTSERRVEANRQNAQKSTGPRTPEGKAASSKNALTHGLTALTHALLSGESVEVYQEHLDSWLEHYGDEPASAALAERSCVTAWKLRRLDRMECALVSEQIRHASDNFDVEQIRRAQTLGEKLFLDPLNRCQDMFPETPEHIRLLNEWRTTEPAVVKAELETFAAGVDWMLARWDELNVIIETEGFWHYDARYHVIKLLGRRPEDVMRDPVIRDLQLSCNVLHPQAWKTYDDAYQATIGSLGRPTYYYRLETIEFLHKPSKEDAILFLKHFIPLETERLKKLKAEHLDPIAAAGRSEAPARFLFGGGPDAALRLRYEIHLDRTLRADVAELMKMKKASQKAEKVPEAPPQVEAPPVVAAEAAGESAAHAYFEQLVQNEPNAKPAVWPTDWSEGGRKLPEPVLPGPA
jgi:hypothetical protein